MLRKHVLLLGTSLGVSSAAEPGRDPSFPSRLLGACSWQPQHPSVCELPRPQDCSWVTARLRCSARPGQAESDVFRAPFKKNSKGRRSPASSEKVKIRSLRSCAPAFVQLL